MSCAALIALVTSVAQPSWALVSGFYDSVEKIQTILLSEDVAKASGQMPVRSLEEIGKTKNSSAVWLLRFQECDVVVELGSTSPDGVGKVSYTVLSVSSCN